MTRKHHDLIVWQQAIALVKLVYTATREFPREETYGLTAQIRRAAISVPSNIAEGAARSTDREFAQFLTIARGSLSELETQIILARELGYLSDDSQLRAEVDQVFRLLAGLLNAVRAGGSE